MFLEVNFGGGAKFYQVNPKVKYAREISRQAYSRWTKPGAAVGGPFSDYWSIKVDGSRGDENVAYFRHAGGKNWNLVGSKLTSTGADRDAVIAMMSKFVKSHGARIIGDDGVPTFFKTENYNLEPRNMFSWVATPVATAPAVAATTPIAVGIQIGTKSDPAVYTFINRRSTSVIPVGADSTSRQNCRALGKKADRKYITFAWFDGRYTEANGENVDVWNDMYQAKDGVDGKKYALVVYTEDNKDMFKRRKSVYDLQGDEKILPDLYDSWQCEKDSGSSVILPQYDPDDGPDSYYLTYSEEWEPVADDTTGKNFVKENCRNLTTALVKAKYLFVGGLKDLIKHKTEKTLRVWNAGVLMYFDTSDTKWKNLGIDDKPDIVEALNNPPVASSGSSTPKQVAGVADASNAAEAYVARTYGTFTMQGYDIFEDSNSGLSPADTYHAVYFEKLYR